ncbi:DUF3987 domain-containing protein [Candidatus Atribacteria bacterium 1244-E10-H5-B2]|nr:MAG: DUF3987 domain-containing protein [Candidatus Atribacteria bacterium 1244-E10-H5-B2]
MREYLKQRGFDEEIIKDWNLVPTTNEVLINYLDPGGALLYARRNRPGKKPKYISPTIKKMPGEHSSLYGLHMLKHVTDTLLLIEGEYNCISAWIMGYSALGVPGQSIRLKDRHLKYIPDTVKKIVILFDEPRLAEIRAKEILEYFDFRIKVCIAKYPDNKDANNYLVNDLHLEFKAIINIADRYFWDRLRSADFKVEIPEDDFIESYKEYAGQISDAPAKYQELMALAIISTIVNRNVYLKWGRRNLYPNLYIVLIGKSTVMRKTEALDGALQTIYHINKDLIFPSEFTQEALFNHISDNPVGIISWTEFGGFLAGASKSYKSDIKEFLTSVYDCPNFLKKKLVDREYIIEKPFINIITATTIHWFVDRITEADTLGGFLGRFVYMPCTKDDRNDWYWMPQMEPVNTGNMLIANIKNILEIKGEFKISDEAKTVLIKYLKRHDDEIWELDDTKGLIGFYGRLADYVFKFAMLYEISGYKSLVISENSVMRSIKLVNQFKQSLNKLLGDYVAFTKEAKDIQRVLNLIKNEGTIRRDRLMQNSHMTAKQLDEVISTLIQSNRIIAIYLGEGQRKARAYKAI